MADTNKKPGGFGKEGQPSPQQQEQPTQQAVIAPPGASKPSMAPAPPPPAPEPPKDEVQEGGRYQVGERLVNANGEPLEGEEEKPA